MKLSEAGGPISLSLYAMLWTTLATHLTRNQTTLISSEKEWTQNPPVWNIPKNDVSMYVDIKDKLFIN